MKYFVLGALASGMLLYGMSMVYGATGSLDLDAVTRAILGGAGQPDDPAVRPRVRRVGDRVQAGRGAVPHVGAGRVRRRADGRHADDRQRPKLAAFAFMLRLLARAVCRASSSTGRAC